MIRRVIRVRIFCSSAPYMMASMGESGEPCGIPLGIGIWSEVKPSKVIFVVRSFRNDSIIATVFALNPWCLSLSTSPP
jgi:hypothetical protein